MIRIDFSQIFRIYEEGICYRDGNLNFSELNEKNGYFGEEVFTQGEFKICLYASRDVQIIFPISSFSNSQNPLSMARAKCGCCRTHLESVGVKIKPIENT